MQVRNVQICAEIIEGSGIPFTPRSLCIFSRICETWSFRSSWLVDALVVGGLKDFMQEMYHVLKAVMVRLHLQLFEGCQVLRAVLHRFPLICEMIGP